MPGGRSLSRRGRSGFFAKSVKYMLFIFTCSICPRNPLPASIRFLPLVFQDVWAKRHDSRVYYQTRIFKGTKNVTLLRIEKLFVLQQPLLTPLPGLQGKLLSWRNHFEGIFFLHFELLHGSMDERYPLGPPLGPNSPSTYFPEPGIP